MTTGRVVDTTDGMGDPQEDDLAHDYPEVHLRVRFLDATSAFVEGLGDDHVYSLPGGEGEVEVLLSADGERVRPRTGTPRWGLGWWIDDETVVGVALSGPGRGNSVGPDDAATLITCRVPDGACANVEGTTGQLVRFPSEDAFTGAIDLRGGETP